MRKLVIASCVLLGACNPSFEDTLVGTWECEPAKNDGAMQMTHTLTYSKDGKIEGAIRVVEKTEDTTAILRGRVAGSWTYDGASVIHTTAEEFQDLKVNDKLVPVEEVSPMVLAGFRPENTYNVTIDIVGDDLTWFEDAERKETVARCKRKV